MIPSIDEISVKVQRVMTTNSVVARASINIGNWLSLKGFRIMPSKFREERIQCLYVQPPAYMTRNRQWQDIVFIEDRELWAKIERKIIDAFNALPVSDFEERP